MGPTIRNLVRIRQANTPGMRQIPSEKCFGVATKNAAGTVANSIPYEDWITALYIGSDAQGNNAKAYFDPHFAIFNPNRYCSLQNNACVLGRSDTRAGTGIDPYSTRSELQRGEARGVPEPGATPQRGRLDDDLDRCGRPPRRPELAGIDPAIRVGGQRDPAGQLRRLRRR